jgi:amino acid transporter
MENTQQPNVTSAQPKALRKVIGILFIWALASATILGPWLIMTQWWYSLTGPSLSLAFLVTMLLMIPVGLCYGELVSMLPWAGGSYNFIGHAFGPGISFIFMWWQTICYFAVIAFNILAPVFILQYVGILPQTNEALIGGAFIFATLYAILNWFKVELSATIQFALFLLLFITGIIWNGFGLFASGQWTTANFSPFMPYEWNGFMVAAGVMVTMYFGFEVVAHMAEEMKFPPKRAVLTTVGAILTAGFVYVVTLTAMAGVAPLDYLINTVNVPGEIIYYVWGNTTWAYIGWVGIILGALACALTCVDGFWLALSRLFYALGQAKLFPKPFASLNKYSIPGIANIAVYAGLLPCILLSGTAWIQTLFVIMGLGIAIVYLGATLSLIRLRMTHPEWKRPYKVPAGYLVGAIGVFASLFCIYWSAVAMTIEGWYLTIGYLIIGVIFYIYVYNLRKREGVKPELMPPVQ